MWFLCIARRLSKCVLSCCRFFPVSTMNCNSETMFSFGDRSPPAHRCGHGIVVEDLQVQRLTASWCAQWKGWLMGRLLPFRRSQRQILIRATQFIFARSDSISVVSSEWGQWFAVRVRFDSDACVTKQRKCRPENSIKTYIGSHMKRNSLISLDTPAVVLGILIRDLCYQILGQSAVLSSGVTDRYWD